MLSSFTPIYVVGSVGRERFYFLVVLSYDHGALNLTGQIKKSEFATSDRQIATTGDTGECGLVKGVGGPERSDKSITVFPTYRTFYERGHGEFASLLERVT